MAATSNSQMLDRKSQQMGVNGGEVGIRGYVLDTSFELVDEWGIVRVTDVEARPIDEGRGRGCGWMWGWRGVSFGNNGFMVTDKIGEGNEGEGKVIGGEDVIEEVVVTGCVMTMGEEGREVKGYGHGVDKELVVGVIVEVTSNDD